MIAEEVPLPVDDPHVEPDQHDPRGAEQERQIDGLEPGIAAVMNATRIGRERVPRPAFDQTEVILVRDDVVVIRAVTDRGPPFASEIRSA